ncbi:TetR/AcrR family transcriptional regulator [Gudongella oleilytica]|uniref:TetR/AcrR family transcriptional regulator n=1 Tax=Gudongella oleilytica TaxID=1582259 RepID=UPI002A3675CD|nr:TetR/AcrR family transcriptional regulator [Gudongella oleilytica]MDY0257637.1 TetR/AcrR family transcriptional regulator [Gudongella oleilytica]
MEKICDSAEKLFSQKGYYNTSINDITSDANVAPGTFYIYFNDKKSVFQYLIHDLSKELRRQIRSESANCKTRYEAEFQGMKSFFKFVQSHVGLYKIIWEAQFVDFDIFKDYYDSFAERYIMNIKGAQEAGEMKEMDPEALAYCLMGISNFIGLKWLIFEEKEVPDEVITQIMAFIKSGIFK